MNIRIKLSSVLLIVAAFLLVFSSYTSLASGQTGGGVDLEVRQPQNNPDNTIQFVVPGGPGFVSVTGGTFTPTSSAYEWDSYWGYLVHLNSTLDGSYISPIALPQGATVSQLVAYYYDASIGNDIKIELFRMPVNSFDPQLMATVWSLGAIGTSYWYDNTIEFATIDNMSYSYYAKASFPQANSSSIALFSVRVDYSFPNYIPMVIK